MSVRFHQKNDNFSRSISQSTSLPQATSKDDEDPKSAPDANGQGQAERRMSERLEQMTDEMIEQDGRRTRKVIEEGGFSKELKMKLEARLQESSFRNENVAAFAQTSLPVRLPICSLNLWH